MLPAAVTVRDAAPGDDAFLRFLHSDVHPEFAALPLPAPDIARLVDLQLAAQRAQYRASHPSSRDRIVEVDGEPVGRCWTDDTDDELRLLDLAVLTHHRRRGIATSLLTALRERAAETGRPLRLRVWFANDAARRLYESLGLRAGAETGGYVAMQWTPAVSPIASGRR